MDKMPAGHVLALVAIFGGPLSFAHVMIDSTVEGVPLGELKKLIQLVAFFVVMFITAVLISPVSGH